MWETSFKTCLNEQGQCGAWSGVIDTQIFCACPVSAHPWVKKCHLLTFVNTKITTSANYTDDIGKGYTSHDKEICLHGKRLKNNLKINQSNLTDAVMKQRRGGR